MFFCYLLSVSIRSYQDPTFWSLIHNVNLIFHEAGHMILMLFGKFFHVFGGTLFEFGIPLFITIYFLLQKKWFSACFGAWWLSTAFYGISIYARDAILMQLPLLGGESVSHDWNTLLNMLDVLKHTYDIANFIFLLSLTSLAIAVYFLYLDLKTELKLTRNETSIT